MPSKDLSLRLTRTAGEIRLEKAYRSGTMGTGSFEWYPFPDVNTPEEQHRFHAMNEQIVWFGGSYPRNIQWCGTREGAD